jgi:hypothetical protein
MGLTFQVLKTSIAPNYKSHANHRMHPKVQNLFVALTHRGLTTRLLVLRMATTFKYSSKIILTLS